MRCKSAFVFGKFHPFHLGHRALINFALSKCERLIVVVCCSDKETIDGRIRVRWIQETYQNEVNLKILQVNYKETELPNTSEPSREVSKLWAARFQSVLPEVDLVVTSEEYGEYVAEFMKIQHILFDKERSKFPISSTMIRKSVYDNWDYLPISVKPHFQRKVVFLGTECTGKTSISKAISNRFNSSWVSEIGREIVANSNDISLHQLQTIISRHAEGIRLAMSEMKPIVLIDTDIHITQSYAHFCFGRYIDVKRDTYKVNRADIYLYLTKEFPYYNDGTRMSEDKRDELDRSHRKVLNDFKIPYHEIMGTWEERLIATIKLVKSILP